MLESVLTAAVLVGGGLAFASSAQAAAQCPSGQICLFQNINETGSMADQANLNSSPWKINSFLNSHYTNGASMQDSASSVVNNSSHTLFLFADINQGGTVVEIFPGTRVNLTSASAVVVDQSNPFGHLVTINFNDLASSAQVVG